MFIKFLLRLSLSFVCIFNISYAESIQTNLGGAYSQVGIGYAGFLAKDQTGSTTLLPPHPYAGSYRNSGTGKDIYTPTINLTLGYNKRINRDFLLGIGATYFPLASSSSNLSITTPSLSSTTNGKYNIRSASNIFFSTGYVLENNSVVYVKLGRATTKASAYAPTGANAFSNKEIGLNGTSAGIGHKIMLNKSFFWVTEINTAKFHSPSVTVTTNSGAIVSTSITGRAIDLIVGIGINY